MAIPSSPPSSTNVFKFWKTSRNSSTLSLVSKEKERDPRHNREKDNFGSSSTLSVKSSSSRASSTSRTRPRSPPALFGAIEGPMRKPPKPLVQLAPPRQGKQAAAPPPARPMARPSTAPVHRRAPSPDPSIGISPNVLRGKRVGALPTSSSTPWDEVPAPGPPSLPLCMPRRGSVANQRPARPSTAAPAVPLIRPTPNLRATTNVPPPPLISPDQLRRRASALPSPRSSSSNTHTRPTRSNSLVLAEAPDGYGQGDSIFSRYHGAKPDADEDLVDRAARRGDGEDANGQWGLDSNSKEGLNIHDVIRKLRSL